MDFRILAGMATRPLLSTEYSACPLNAMTEKAPRTARQNGEQEREAKRTPGMIPHNSPRAPQCTHFPVNVKVQRQEKPIFAPILPHLRHMHI